LVAVALTVALGSCGINLGGADDGAGDWTPEERAYVDAYADILCASISCCPRLGSPEISTIGCRQKAERTMNDRRGVLPSFSPKRAAACLKVLQNESKECVFRLVDEAVCFGDWNRGQPPGAACSLNNECAESNGSLGECEFSACNELRTVAEGEACNATPDAAHVIRRCDEKAGLTCGQASGLCQRPIALGGSCQQGDVPCSGEAFCLDGVCRARGKQGAACMVSEGCLTGLFCNGTCQPRAAAGGSCQQSLCVESAECLTDAICRRLRNLGESCDPASDFCNLGSICQNGFCSASTVMCQ
jgi:hypothetical protein